jgi:5'-3' exonuclease
MKYLLVDTANTFFKSRHIASRHSDDWQKIGMALHLTLSSIQSVVRKFATGEPVHVVFCLEGRSWRKDVYEPYKRNRAVKYAALTESEQALDKMFWETYEQFTTYLQDKTNVSVLRCPTAEADDIIARFIHLHPGDHHYVLSSDSDFAQLIAPNVHQYNSLSNHLITLEGYYDDRGREVKDKKSGQHKKLDDPGYLLFEKCMRGDTSDNVFSAYPGVRTKSTKKSVGLIDAYADRDRKGFNWNNLMLQQWLDHEGVQHRVLDDYQRNVILCDLTAQPPEIKQTIDDCIKAGIRETTTSNVGIHLMKFCSKFELVKISEQADSYARWLNNPYKGILRG